ncbi:geranylgeranyl diphosphate reductase, chloroplastic [Beta vulgaris subsp. vulgaris]|uniref:geranylgeranyl diphosphate reductase, chloroplastic n=1 Tax=Beta vulgaris subsp. vulgaris TaxID=3555 RepID=UPI0020368119|nr:geranylgeranyl diphosphate reductase, chloroplastic [Beta vulgaris subsp. vulgaris]
MTTTSLKLNFLPSISSHLSLPSNNTQPPSNLPISTPRKLRAAVIGGGPAGSSAAEALSSVGIETFLFERNVSGSKPCGGAIPLCMLHEFNIPRDLVDREVKRMRIFSPSNLSIDFGKTLLPSEFIAMTRREVLDSFLRDRAQSSGAQLICGLVNKVELPAHVDSGGPYVVHYSLNGSKKLVKVDVVIGADGVHSRVAKSINAGNYQCALAFQERIRLPEEEMEYYKDLAEMYVGDDVSPDFYGWVFPKCDHVAVGTGTVKSKLDIKRFQYGIRARAGPKISGGRVFKVEAHPIPEHPRPVRVRGRVALVGDAAGYVTKCSGEGIYFAAKSGRVCGEAVVAASEGGTKMIKEEDLKREYLKKWDGDYKNMFRFLDLLQNVFYGSNANREALVELCGDEYVQRMTFDSYLYKKLAKGNPWEDTKMVMNTIGSLARCNLVGQRMELLSNV